MLNGLEKTLERKVPTRERRWQVAKESAAYGVNYELCLQGLAHLLENRILTPETRQLTPQPPEP